MGKREVWHDKLTELGAERGFYRVLGAQHKALFLQGNKTLVVSFDNLDDARQDTENRLPWGSEFISSRGWSSLGISAHGWTWYRDEAVLDFFDELRDTNFFDQFDKVVFYGTSMAGYAAAAFSSACPGATVIAMNPQATLERAVTSGWETRYHRSWTQDFSGRYSYAPDQAKAAKAVYLFYDPSGAHDAMHASLFRGENIIKIKCRHCGHGLTSSFNAMGILKDIVKKCVDEEPTPLEIYQLMLARKTSLRYQKTVLKKLEAKGRPRLTYQFCKHVLAMPETENRGPFRKAMKAVAKFVPPEMR